VAEEKKSWVKAAWLSGALLVIPVVGFVLLFMLPDGDSRPERPRTTRVEDRDPAGSPPPASELDPRPDPRPAPTPEPLDDVPEDEPLDEEVVEEREPSVLDPCCAALEAALETAKKGRGTLRAALRACDNGRDLTDPTPAFRATNRLLERQGMEIPRACMADE
jgi:hypothetical protein